MFARLLILFYAIVSYVVFLVSFLYALGFVGNYLVPKSIDAGGPADLSEAVVVDLLLLGIFAMQHSIMARPAFKQWWAENLSGGLPAQHLRATLQPDPSAVILAVAADPDTRLAGPRICGLVADRRLLVRLVGRACLNLHDRSFRSVRPAPGFLRAARRGASGSIVQDAPALQGRAASAHAGLSARILGHT